MDEQVLVVWRHDNATHLYKVVSPTQDERAFLLSLHNKAVSAAPDQETDRLVQLLAKSEALYDSQSSYPEDDDGPWRLLGPVVLVLVFGWK